MSPTAQRQPSLAQWHTYCDYCEQVKGHRGDYELVVVNDGRYSLRASSVP